ncbi:MAG: hypothetical protein L0Z62_13905 [Gemmataceae bacterium]|nr:hypothetical protein [Gemmataceae bacterium]
MFFYVQAGLALLGAYILARGKLRVGPHEVGPPVASLVGGLLVAPLPLCLFLWAVLGMTATSGLHPGSGRAGALGQLAATHGWLDPVVTMLFVLMGGLLVYFRLQDRDSFPAVGTSGLPRADLDTEARAVPPVPKPPANSVTWNLPRPANDTAIRADAPPRPTEAIRATEEPRRALPPPLPAENAGREARPGGWTPPPPSAIRRYRGTPDAVPAEVAALGHAEQMHPPLGLLTLPRENPRAVILVGAAVVLMTLAILAAARPGPFGRVLCVVGTLAGIAAIASPWFDLGRLRTYLVFRDALVVVQGDDFTVIPWDAFAELNPSRDLVTTDRRQYRLPWYVRDADRLHRAVLNRVTQHLLPGVLGTLREGGEVVFGPLKVGVVGVVYQGRMLPWLDVAQLAITTNVKGRYLHIHERGALFTWCKVHLERIPNDFLLLEVLKRVCPAHLLIPVTSG